MTTSSTAHANFQDWRRRTSHHLKDIADLLIERGEQGMCVQGSYLYQHPELYGRSPRSRISDLNKLHGWDIGSKPGQHGCACYWLRRDGNGQTYPTARFNEPENSPRPRLVKQPEAAASVANSPDWYTKTTGKARASVDSKTLFLWERERV